MISGIDHIVLNCRDVEATASWYEQALGFRRVGYSSPSRPGPRTALEFGEHKINLRQTGDAGWETARVDAPGSLDICFRVDGSLKPMLARWAAAGVTVTVGPVPRSGARGPMTSIYCNDPDGNLVEVSTYAADPLG